MITVFYYIFLGKEEYDNFAEIKKSVEERLGEDTFVCPIPEHQGVIYNIKLEGAMRMVDGKVRAAFSGLGGAFCFMCDCTREEANDKDRIEEGFTINRNPEETKQLWDNLCEIDEDGEEYMPSKKGEPHTVGKKFDSTKSIWIHTFCSAVKILIKYNFRVCLNPFFSLLCCQNSNTFLIE